MFAWQPDSRRRTRMTTASDSLSHRLQLWPCLLVVALLLSAGAAVIPFQPNIARCKLEPHRPRKSAARHYKLAVRRLRQGVAP
jgi:hypothetical protein